MTADKGSEFVRVPVEPTEAMLKAAHAAMLSDIPPDGESTYGPTISTHAIYRAYWAAMLSAAPAPQPVQGEAVQIAAPDHIADARKMVAAPGDVEERARELLRAAQRDMGVTFFSPVSAQEQAALRAITAAMRSQGQADAVDLAQFREAVVHWRTGYFRVPTDAGERVRAESARLLAVIDTAALAQQANKDAPKASA